jgi:predicted nucleic acid-binding protein
MPAINLFLDSSTLVSGILSSQGASRAILVLGESGVIGITISRQVVAESERVIARKVPRAINDFRQAILASNARIVHDPSAEDVRAHSHLISHAADVPILPASMQAKVDYLVTLNIRHFIDDPEVAKRAGLLIGTPGDALSWLRGRLM